jgi:Zn-dependent protease
MVPSDLSIQLVIFRLLALLIISAVHGFSLAAAANYFGDKGPSYDGRHTLNPTKHLDFFGGICTILFGIGWAKPILIDSGGFQRKQIDLIAVILIGFFSLVGLAFFFSILIPQVLSIFSHSVSLSTAAFLRISISISIWFALFSLVPIPPLTAGLLIKGFGLDCPKKLEGVFVGGLIIGAGLGLVQQLLEPLHLFIISLAMVE